VPVYTTAEIGIDVGQPQPATELPLAAASIRGEKASLFIVEGGKVRSVTAEVKGESGGSLYLDPSFRAGTAVVLEGRTLLADGDAVVAKPLAEAPPLTPRAVEGEPASTSLGLNGVAGEAAAK
jgi:hypothetical protein